MTGRQRGDEARRLRNDGDGDLVLLASLPVAPVVVETPDREPIPLPWSE